MITKSIMTNDTAIKPAVIKPKPGPVHVNWLTDDEKIEAITTVADMLSKGERSTVSIQEYLATIFPSGSCHRETAIKYRNAAIKLLEREHKPMNREAMRNLEIGRYTYLIERIYKRIQAFEDTMPAKGHDDYIKAHDTWSKMMQRLNDYGARLHAITGLNEITINNVNDQKRILFVRPSGVDPIQASPPTEGELVNPTE